MFVHSWVCYSSRMIYFIHRSVAMTPIVINIFIYFNCFFFFSVTLCGKPFSLPPKLNISTVERKSPTALCKRFKRKIKKVNFKRKPVTRVFSCQHWKPSPAPFDNLKDGLGTGREYGCQYAMQADVSTPAVGKGCGVPAPPTAGGRVRLGHRSHSPRPNHWQWCG